MIDIFGRTPVPSLMGMRVFADPNLDSGVRLVQVRFPRSRKRRIRKKWAKRPENWASRRVSEAAFYKIRIGKEEVIVAHPFAIEALRQAMAAEPARL